MSYTQEQVYSATLDYFNEDTLATDVFLKYPLISATGEYLEQTPDDLHDRLASEFARIESRHANPLSYDEIRDLFDGFRQVIPQGSPMSGVGNKLQVQSLSNCFVIAQPHDSYGGILFADQEQVQIMKRRGGVGQDISLIRPRGLPTSNAAKTTDGIGVFMERFSNSTGEVAQGGRRGALMLTIDCRHPEIETFIEIKKDRLKVTSANISIRWTDDFMQAVDENREFTLRWPVNVPAEEAEYIKVVNAREIWDKFIEAAWECAEPGALFWDTITSRSPADCYADVGYKTISTNPCSEIPLSPYDSCRLMVINLTSFVKFPFKRDAYFDYDEFFDVAKKAQKLMDDLVDLEAESIDRIIAKIESDPEPMEIKQIELNLWKKVRSATLAGRRTGLGVTGLGDALAYLNIFYGSALSVEVTEKIYKTLAMGAYTSSCEMARDRGAFPIYDASKEENHEFLKQIYEALSPSAQNLWDKYGRRNIALLTTAPVGSVSCLTQTTSGIEPVYMLEYMRRRKMTEFDDGDPDYTDAHGIRWQHYDVYHHGLEKWMRITGEHDITKSPYWSATAKEIDWIESVQIQAAAQKWVCHGISKTCNLPTDVSKDVVSDVYLKAWRSGCKGFTVYREGSRDGVLVSMDETIRTKELPREDLRFKTHPAPKRPEVLDCEIHQVTIKGDKWTIVVGLMDERPYEVLGGLAEYVEIPSKYSAGKLKKRPRKTRNSIYDLVFGDNGDEIIVKDVVSIFDNPNHAGFTRVISLALRHGAPLHYVVEQLQKDKDADMFSFAKVIARVLKTYIDDGTKPGGGADCPECGSVDSLSYTEGCVMCRVCSWGLC